MSSRLTVGSLRGLPQPGVSRAHQTRRPLPMVPSAPKPTLPKRCCGSGCAGCPVGERLRALRAGR